MLPELSGHFTKKGTIVKTNPRTKINALVAEIESLKQVRDSAQRRCEALARERNDFEVRSMMVEAKCAKAEADRAKAEQSEGKLMQEVELLKIEKARLEGALLTSNARREETQRLLDFTRNLLLDLYSKR